PSIVTKIGFKYICGYMIDEDVLVGGEESGGIAVKGHIPERDGVWVALTILEYMVKCRKSLNDLIREIYQKTGSFAMERLDLHINEELKTSVMRAAEKGELTRFDGYRVERTESTDGFKFHLSDDSWVMIRASGTEPVLRIYAEAPNYAEAVNILEATRTSILQKA
ncbi:MAG: phosphoglucomutase/phosphomannomutase family protein, partial [Bacteroidota bacterium]|nr:phosphoglucomutase/phosphomannomutase family protein [Bacteroidota bacterium]